MSWTTVKLKKVLKQYRIEHIVQNDREYKQVTISKHDGVKYRGLKHGKDIGRKRQFIIDLKKYPNTLMLVRQGVYEGAIGIAPVEVDECIATENMPMFSIDNISLDYLRIIIQSPFFKEEIEKIPTTGSAQKSIHEKQILEIEIPLPELNEQLKIVDSFLHNKNRIEAISAEIAHQLDTVKQLRQAFLREAMQGKLTAKWRAENTDVEPARELLKKIKTEKEKLFKEGKLKKQKPLSLIQVDEIPFEIPESWEWCKIDALVLDINKDIRTGPFGTALNKSEHKVEGVPVWGIESISKNGQFTFKNKIFVTNEKAIKMKSFEVYGGDLIISRSGTIGELCMLPYTIEKGLLSTNLMKISIDKRMMLPEVFCHVIKGSSYIEDMLRDFCSGSTRLFLTQKILKKLLFPLPSLAEQQQIVTKLDELMQYCDKLEESIKTSQLQNEMLLQQVLREALESKK
jgi:type I restriction enzyme, S subunit